MNELMNLRDKRVQTWNAAKAFLESHRGTDGTLSAEDDAIFNKMMDEVDKLGKEVVRLEKLEAIATSFEGVEKSYAIQAGREIRIILKPEVISDDQMVIVARDIAKKIEEEMDYPGQIKVNVVRETRAVDYAK